MSSTSFWYSWIEMDLPSTSPTCWLDFWKRLSRPLNKSPATKRNNATAMMVTRSTPLLLIFCNAAIFLLFLLIIYLVFKWFCSSASLLIRSRIRKIMQNYEKFLTRTRTCLRNFQITPLFSRKHPPFHRMSTNPKTFSPSQNTHAHTS